MCYGLRTSRRLKLREVANGIGVSTSTYGNVESRPHRVISDERVAKLADFYRLGPVEKKKLLDLAAQLPLSGYTERQRELWAKKNQMRSKAKRFDLMFEALDNLVCMFAAEGKPCTCTPATPGDFDEEPRPGVTCPACQAMQAMGIAEGYGDPVLALQRIAKLHDRLESAAAKKAEGRPS
jgi:transcriptional regulator with XRE-family HTH domain